MQEKKQIIHKSPDISKMQVVVINHRTKIYIAVGADPEEARNRYFNRPELRAKSTFAHKKPTSAVSDGK
ncbi:MAG: hypothetical protein WCE64_14080 [Bacteroidales bacterium]